VFLGIDHAHGKHEDPPPEPVLFETMVLGESEYACKASKACTIAEARENHARWLRVLHAEAAGLQSDEARADPSIEDLMGMLGLLLQAGPPPEDNGRHNGAVL
jgi:hypothetical protein